MSYYEGNEYGYEIEDYGSGGGHDDYGDEYGHDEYGSHDEYGGHDEYGYGGGEEKVELKDEFKDFERAGGGDECGGGNIEFKGSFEDMSRNINRLILDPTDRFKRHVGAIAKAMEEDGFAAISVNDRNIMCRKASSLLDAKFLNATAFILGYVITSGGEKINKSTMKGIFSSMDDIRDDSVKKPDILRYARYWLTI